MARLNGLPTPMFWNCVGLAIAIISIGTSWNISRTKTFELELAEYRLKTGSALNKVQKASDALEQSAKKLPLATQERVEIQQQLQQSNEIIERAEADIEKETDLLIESTIEE